MTPEPLDVPVLFLIFNRPDTTQRVFDEIRKARPLRLFVAADGPRKDRPEDSALCQKTREILRQVDWECNVSTLFRDENLGCKHAISRAIDWFFSQVEEGIILEDDCVPDQSFFPFCRELLERYRDDERIMMISGINYLFNRVGIPESYYFSRYYAIWGWATWKRAWGLYDIGMTGWPEYDARNYLNQLYCNKEIVSFLKGMMEEAYKNTLDTWDIQWVFTCIFNHGLAACPKYNLVSNIGVSGSHNQEVSRFHFMPVRGIDTRNLVHPARVMPDLYLDDIAFETITRGRSGVETIRSLLYHVKTIGGRR
ncbi:MAG TPA: hypothetical protein PKZ65_05665 [Methanoregulaceae archaeon]|nr:hypothetical protein [Methanoregulaceae archaeon]